MSDLKMVWSKEELEADHQYAQPHIEVDTRLHGGLDQDGNYISPRTLNRVPAIVNWRTKLGRRDIDLIEANISLQKEDNYPNPEQQKHLLRNGLDQTLFDSLTNIGRIEASGVMISQLTVPDFQSIIEEDISGTTLGHLDKGLFTSHGWDEGGKPDSDEGGHDAMWYTVRDLLWDAGTYELPEPGAGAEIKRNEQIIPQIPAQFERILDLMMQILLLEMRAYQVFAISEDVMRDASLFTDRRDQAELAADIVHRIRMDETIHVGYLQTALTEFRSYTVKTVSGASLSGADLFDRSWEDLCYHAGVLQPRQQRAEMEIVLKERILAEADGEQIFKEFQALSTPPP